jgi:hypothetical protein
MQYGSVRGGRGVTMCFDVRWTARQFAGLDPEEPTNSLP